LGDTATGVWKRLVKTPGRFLSVGTEGLFAPLLAKPPAGMERWAEYLSKRYPKGSIVGGVFVKSKDISGYQIDVQNGRKKLSLSFDAAGKLLK